MTYPTNFHPLEHPISHDFYLMLLFLERRRHGPLIREGHARCGVPSFAEK